VHWLRPGPRRRGGAPIDDPKRIVERGFDEIADRFAEWQSEISDETRLRYLADLLELLPERPAVLELGVGAGVESSRILAERGRLTGVDLSQAQLRRARERLPGANLIHGDYFAGCDSETNRRLAEEAGLEVVRDELEVMIEPEGEVRWQWLLAQHRR
jgi:predicted TPR repeat methyltransferase